MRTLSFLAFVGFSLSFSPVFGANEEFEIGEYRFALKDPWKLAEGKYKAPKFVAVWVNPKSKVPNAAMVASSLAKSVKEEADAMAASAERQPAAIKLLEDRTIKLNDRDEARVVSLAIDAGNELLDIKGPMVFHSIYLAAKDGSAVTVKLMCDKADLDKLKKDFEAIVLEKVAARKQELR